MIQVIVHILVMNSVFYAEIFPSISGVTEMFIFNVFVQLEKQRRVHEAA